MELRLGQRIFQVPDRCMLDAPSKGTLIRDLREHGPEAFLASHKLGQFAPCLVEELKDRGVELVGDPNVGTADIVADASDEQATNEDGGGSGSKHVSVELDEEPTLQS